MGVKKQKAVVNLETDQLVQAEQWVRAGRYRTLSALMREAIADKLVALSQSRVAEQVERYCANELDHEDDELIAAQRVEEPAPTPRVKRRSRAAR